MKARTLFFAAAVLLLAASCKTRLFNGKDLTGWGCLLQDETYAVKEVFSVQDGCINVSGQPFGFLYTEKVFRNYELDVEWRWTDGPANSGIFLILQEVKNPFPKAVECQLKAGNVGDFVLLGGSELEEVELPSGLLRPRFPVKPKTAETNEMPAGEWNKVHAVVNEGKIQVYLNGVLMNEGTSPVKEGRIALQSEGGKLAFRNITIKEKK